MVFWKTTTKSLWHTVLPQSGPGQLSEAIAHKDCARYSFAVQIAGMRQDGGYSSAQVVATDDGRLPDLNASNIGDGIERPSW